MLTLTADQTAAIQNFSAGLISVTDLVFAIYSSVERNANVMHIVALGRTLEELADAFYGDDRHTKIDMVSSGADVYMVLAQEIDGELKYATVSCTL